MQCSISDTFLHRHLLGWHVHMQELALLTGEKRLATVISREEVELITVDKDVRIKRQLTLILSNYYLYSIR